MTTVTEWLRDTFGMGPQSQARLLGTLVVLVLLWFLRRLVMAAVRRRTDDVRLRYRWQKLTAYATGLVGLFLVARIWLEGFGSVATFLGLASAGLAIALKDLLVNMAGWAFILWRRPFVVGDRIQIGDRAGDVIDIRLFQFSLLEIGNWVEADQSTGRVLHVPNGRVMTDVTANYTRGFNYIWNELPVLVTFESNWRKARDILLRVVREQATEITGPAERHIKEVSQQFLISYTTLTPTVYTSVADSGVLLTVRYLCVPRERRTSAERLWEAILDGFAPHADIDFAYPTRRFFDHRVEGKPALASPEPAAPR